MLMLSVGFRELFAAFVCLSVVSAFGILPPPHHTFQVAKLPQGSLKICWYFFLFFRPIETLIEPYDSFEWRYINTSCGFVRENLI